MSVDPKVPSPLSDEARELLSAAIKPRPMSLVERKVAAHAVAKIAAAPVGLVAGGITASKFVTGAAVVGASVATIVTAQSVANRPTAPRTSITRPHNASAPRAIQPAPVARITAVAPVAPETPVAPVVLALPASPTASPTSVEPARRVNELSARVRVNRVPARPFVAPSALAASSAGLALPEQTLAQPQEQRENNALQQVMTAIARDPASALSMLDVYDREFPRGRLRDEREFLGVLALDRSGRRDEARTRAEAFLERAPMSMYAPRLRRLLNRSQ